MNRNKYLRPIWLLIILSGGIALAQTTGTISGTMSDSTGALVPGGTVEILNRDTGLTRKVETDSSGRYSALSLSPGNYQVTAIQEGFQTEVRTGIVLTVGREAIVDLLLTVGAVTQRVEVAAEAPLVESTTASLGSLVDDRTIRALPLNGRSYDQLAALQPGVILSSPGNLSAIPFQNGSGKRFSVGGQRGGSNLFLLDGTNINDQGNGTPGGAAGTNLGVDTILEFKIFTNSFKAEYGHSNGSVVTAITRSGTNTLHGTAFEYIRNSALDARNFFDRGSSPPSFKRNQFGGVLGGRIKKDKTFFFGGYEGLRQGLGTTLIATVPTLLTRQGILPSGTVPVSSAIVPYLNLYPAPNGRDFGDGTGEFLSSPTIVTNEDNVMGRIDHQLTSRTSIFGRYTFDNDKLNAPLNLPTLVTRTASRRQYTTVQATSILGPKMLNSFRFAFNRSYSVSQPTFDAPAELSFVPGQPMGALQIGASQTAGTRPLTALGPTSGAAPTLWAFNTLQWSDDFSYVTGKHSLKFGVDLQRLRDNYTKGSNVKGVYTFATINDFLAGNSSNLQAAAPLGNAANWGIRQNLIGLYAQDDITVTSRLTVNLGLRWETNTDPREVNGKMAILPSLDATSTVPSDTFFSISKKNFEPRVGIAWRLNASGKTVLRAGGGTYHNQIFPVYYQQKLSLPPFFGNLSANNPTFPNGFGALAASGLVQLQVMNPFQKTPVNHQYNISIQQQISKSTVVQISYAGNKANHLEIQREADTPIPTILPNGQKFFPLNAPRRNPAWDGIRYYELAGNSNYNAVTFLLRRQSSSGFQGQIFYTFSKALDHASGVTTADSLRSPSGLLDQEDRARDWALSDFNVKHQVVLNFSYQLPFRSRLKGVGPVLNGWTLDGIGTFTSGQPFTPRLGAAVFRNLVSDFAERPDLKPGAGQNPTEGVTVGCTGIPAGQQLGTADRFYDPCGFAIPLAGTYGNLGRNTIIGPGMGNVDLALGETFSVREATSVTFKAEVFNIMNHTNLGLPNTTALTAAGAGSGSAGRVTYTTTTARQLQFVLRINF